MAKPKSDSRQVNTRLYECQDCHVRRFIPWVEFNRAARPRCYACGSTQLELVSEKAKEDKERLQRQRLIGTGGSLKLADNLEEISGRKMVR